MPYVCDKCGKERSLLAMICNRLAWNDECSDHITVLKFDNTPILSKNGFDYFRKSVSTKIKCGVFIWFDSKERMKD